MTKEESIALAEKLQKNYSNLDALKDQIEKNESQMKSRSSTTVRGSSYFRFFWPWLIVAAVLYFLIGFIHNVGFRYSADSVQYTLMTVRVLAPIAALILGAILAGVKKSNDSNQVAQAQYSAAQEVAKLKLANDDNRTKIARIEKELEEYRDLVPANARTRTAMFKVVSMLKTGKAEDFNDAISKLYRSTRFRRRAVS